MDCVPFIFCDSVVLVGQVNRYGEPFLEPLEKLLGYWGVAAGMNSNHLVRATLNLQPVDSDNWNYELSLSSEIFANWKEIREAKRCLVILHLIVSATNPPLDESISTVELKNLLAFGYRKPLKVSVPENETFTPQQNLQVANLIDNLNVSSISVNYAPEFERFVVKAMASKYLLHAGFYSEIPEALLRNVLEWAHRDEFEYLHLCREQDVIFDFPIFERFMRRALTTIGADRMSLSVKFSDADWKRILAFPGSNWVKQKYSPMSEHWVCRKKSGIMVYLSRWDGWCTVSYAEGWK